MNMSRKLLLAASTLAAVVAGGITQANADTTWKARSVAEVKASIDQVGFNNYVIVRGDTLWAISQATNVSVDQLMAIYHTDNPNLIIAGTHLVFNGDHMTVITQGGQVTGTYSVTPAQSQTSASVTQGNQYTLQTPATNNTAGTAQGQSTSVSGTTNETSNASSSVGVATAPSQNNSQAVTSNTTGESGHEDTVNQADVAYSVNYYAMTENGLGDAYHVSAQAKSGQRVTVSPQQYASQTSISQLLLGGSDGPEGRIDVDGSVPGVNDNNLSTPDNTPTNFDSQTTDFSQSFTANGGNQQVNFYYAVSRNF